MGTTMTSRSEIAARLERPQRLSAAQTAFCDGDSLMRHAEALHDFADQQAREIAELEAKVAGLREALLPFARAADEIATKIAPLPPGCFAIDECAVIDAKHLRNARAALTGTSEGDAG